MASSQVFKVRGILIYFFISFSFGRTLELQKTQFGGSSRSPTLSFAPSKAHPNRIAGRPAFTSSSFGIGSRVSRENPTNTVFYVPQVVCHVVGYTPQSHPAPSSFPQYNLQQPIPMLHFPPPELEPYPYHDNGEQDTEPKTPPPVQGTTTIMPPRKTPQPQRGRSETTTTKVMAVEREDNYYDDYELLPIPSIGE